MSSNIAQLDRSRPVIENARQLILQNALDEFAALGFSGSTTRGIASRAGLSHGVIRYYYKTKEKLWFEAVDFLFARLEKEVSLTAQESQLLRDGNVDIFRNWLRQYVHYCARHPEHARIMFQESLTGSDRLKTAVERHSRKDHHQALDIIKALKKNGVFPAEASPVSILYTITGAAQNIFALAAECRMSLGHDPFAETAISAHADVVVNLICPKK